MKTLHGLLALSLLGILSACQFPAASQRGIDAVQVAKLVTNQGTTEIIGNMTLPSNVVSSLISNNSANLISNNAGSLISNNTAQYRTCSLGDPVPLPRIQVQVVDSKGNPLPGVSSVLTASDGSYLLPRVPIGTSMLVEGIIPTNNGQPIKLHKFLRPSDSLTCGKVNLATTLVADKLTSNNPLVKSDPALAGSDLFDLVDPTKLQAIEDDVQQALSGPNAPSPQALANALAQGTTTAVFDQLVQTSPAIGDAYQQSFARPDSSIGVKIMAVGKNNATIKGGDGSNGTTVVGIMSLKTEGAPTDTVKIEYWLNGKKILEAPPPGVTTLDTWNYPNGPYTLEAFAVRSDGSRESLCRTFMVINNSLDMLCP